MTRPAAQRAGGRPPTLNKRGRFERLLVQLPFLAIWLVGSSITFARDIRINEPAPDFHATTFDGREISLADYKGRVLIINFWATWCVPCLRHSAQIDSPVGDAAGTAGCAVFRPSRLFQRSRYR
jgi:hypothetical protein